MSEGAPFRHMKYPYTFTAKVAQFPYKYYWKHSWLFRYWLIGSLVSLPVFYKIQKLSYSPGNVQKWEKIWAETFNPSSHH